MILLQWAVVSLSLTLPGQGTEVEGLLEELRRRERLLDGAVVEYAELSFEETTPIPFRLEHVVVELLLPFERWTRRLAEPGSDPWNALLEGAIDDPTWQWLASGVITELSISDGGRQLSVSPDRRHAGVWSGILYEGLQPTLRSGGLNSGLMFQELWLSECVSGWELLGTHAGPGGQDWLFATPQSDGLWNLYRLRVEDGGLATRVVWSRTTSEGRDDILRNERFEMPPVLPSNETPCRDCIVVTTTTFEGLSMPESVECVTTYAGTLSTIYFRFSRPESEPESVASRFDVRAVPPEAAGGPVVVWDQFAGRSITLGESDPSHPGRGKQDPWARRLRWAGVGLVGILVVRILARRRGARDAA